MHVALRLFVAALLLSGLVIAHDHHAAIEKSGHDHDESFYRTARYGSSRRLWLIEPYKDLFRYWRSECSVLAKTLWNEYAQENIITQSRGSHN